MSTRHSDHPEDAARIVRARTEGRKRTILLSIIAAGLVSLFMARAIEVETANEQVDRSRKNCEIVMDDFRARAETLEKESDQVLGNLGKEPPVHPIKLKGTAFEDFIPIIVAQAKDNRERAKEIRASIQNCNDVFPKRHTWFFD